MTSMSSSQAPGKKRKAVCVQLLNHEEYVCYVDVKSKVQDVFNQVANYLSLRETEYFGLALKKDGEYQFLSNDEKIHKHAAKQWKQGPGDGFDGHGKPLVVLYFRVQFYVDQIVLLREKVTRHQYYLQLKHNVLNYSHGLEEKCFLIAAYALQADYGNITSISEHVEYFDPREYFPAWMLEKHGQLYLIENTPVVHRDLHNLPRSEAEWRFIKETSNSPTAHNLHFYRLRKKKTDKIWNAWLGICAKGIEIYEDIEDGFKDLISTFLWPDIGKLTFDKKKFEIRSVGTPAGRKFTYYTDCDVKSKYLLTLSRNTHMFQLAIQPKLMEIRHLEEEDKRRFRESYIYSDSRDQGNNGGSYRSNISPRTKTAMGNRYSVVSDASSNTTSGIASDKMAVSFEESDDFCTISDVTREIMIDTPPLTNMLLHTPSQTRSKIVSTLPGYKPSPVPGANRSPVLDHQEQFNAYTFPSSRSALPSSPFHLTNQNNISSGSVQSDRSGSGQSEVLSVGSGSSGSYRKRLKQQQAQSGMYSPGVHSYTDGVREKTSRPASRSASRKDSFKEIMALLQTHRSNNPEVLPPSQPHLVQTPQLKHVPSFHMEDLDYLNGPVSRSGSSDHRTNRSYGSDLSTHSSVMASISTVTSIGDHLSRPSNSYGSAASFGSSDARLFEAEEKLLPPPLFADDRGLFDMPSEQILVPSPTESELVTADSPSDEDFETIEDALQSLDNSLDLQDSSGTDIELGGDNLAVSASSKSKNKPTHITVNNQKEVLHPEIEEIRGQSHAFSLPFITALCNDKTLLPLHSNSGSIAGSYDMSSIRSTDSRISRISHDTDARRLSVNYPSSSGGTLGNSSNRPFSWHSESFDLDAQLANLNAASNIPPSENYRSVPQSLSNFTTTDTLSWTNAISYATQQGLDRYSPELIASQLMIPPKLSSGGHNSTDSNIRHKSLMKENIGIA